LGSDIGMATSMNETEIKYELPTGVALPKLDTLAAVGSVQPAADEDLEAQYFDTEDLRLIRAGVTLRRRTGGHDAGWHLKTPAGPNTRREFHSPLYKQTPEVESPDGRPENALRHDDAAVPAELMDLILVYSRGLPVRPTAVIRTQRQRLLLLGESGNSLAELAVDDVHAHRQDGDPAPRGWREVELELTGGDGGLLREADKVLRQGGLRRSGQEAKFARAMGVGPLGRPAGEETGLSASSSAGTVITAYLAEQAGLVKALDPAVRGDQPDAVHQMRIAVRKLRSTLRTFGGVIWRRDGGQNVDRLAGELKWLGNHLGGARDAEVLLGRLRSEVDALPVELALGPIQARIQGHFARVSADAKEALAAALRSQRYFSLLDQLDALVEAPSLTRAAGRPARAVLPAGVRRSYRRTARRMDRAEGTPAGSKQDVALHRARRAAKRARFAAEAVAPAFGQPATRFAQRLKKVQSTLGDHQDSVIARRAIRELAIAASQSTENAFSYGILYQRETDASGRGIADGERAWSKASRRKYRTWLGGQR
jgi:CHAD domain-containing protein